MLDHLDDPRPPTPSDTLAQTLQAEGARRRRRRARVAGGAALATVLLMAGAVVRPWEGDDEHVEVGPTNTTTTQPAPTSTTMPEATTTTTREPPPPDAFPENTFAAVTEDGRVVLADLASGETVVELDRFDPADGGFFVARAPDGSAVFAGGYTQGVWRYVPFARPVRLGSAADVSVSPDGARLAVVSPDADDFGTIRIIDSTTGEVLDAVTPDELSPEGHSPRTTAWSPSGDRLLIEANLPESGGEVFILELGGGVRRLGPPEGLPNGTGWYLGGPARDGQAWVLEDCCALDANSYDGGLSLVRIDDQTGAVLGREPLDAPNRYFVLEAGPPDEGFLLLSPAYEGNEAAGVLVGSPDGSLEAKTWPAFLTVDW